MNVKKLTNGHSDMGNEGIHHEKEDHETRARRERLVAPIFQKKRPGESEGASLRRMFHLRIGSELRQTGKKPRHLSAIPGKVVREFYGQNLLFRERDEMKNR
jgi:hypothetical protein